MALPKLTTSTSSSSSSSSATTSTKSATDSASSTGTGSEATSTGSETASTSASWSTPDVTVPATDGNPYIYKAHAPRGTVFICLGVIAVVVFLIYAFFMGWKAWRSRKAAREIEEKTQVYHPTFVGNRVVSMAEPLIQQHSRSNSDFFMGGNNNSNSVVGVGYEFPNRFATAEPVARADVFSLGQAPHLTHDRSRSVIRLSSTEMASPPRASDSQSPMRGHRTLPSVNLENLLND